MSRIEVVVCETPVLSSAAVIKQNITNLVDGPYTWTIAAQGGFKTASVNLRMPLVMAYKFLNDYIGKRLQFLSPLQAESYQPRSAMGVCWEGMISTITIDNGSAPITRTVANCYNHVTVVYPETDYTQATPVLGKQARTLTTINTESRGLYGIRELYYTVGGMAAINADAIRNKLLRRYQMPITQFAQLATGIIDDPSDAVVTLDCTGYWETFDKRIYLNTAVSPTPINIDLIVASVLAANTGIGQFLLGNPVLAANALQFTPYQDQIMTAQQLLNKLCSFGHYDAQGPSYIGIYGGPIANYSIYPTQASYRLQRFDNMQRIIDDTPTAYGRVVNPWEVRPAKIITVADALPETAVYANDVLDVRSFVIGEVTFTSPRKLVLRPAVVDPMQVTLSRLSIGGTV